MIISGDLEAGSLSAHIGAAFGAAQLAVDLSLSLWMLEMPVVEDGCPAQRRLVLISQQVAGTDDSVFVFGLSALEYDQNCKYRANRRKVYLQYVDTTGLFVPREKQSAISKAITIGYMRFIEQLGFDMCYIFANANPEYLFSRSEYSPQKRVLGDTALLRWWAKTVVAGKFRKGFWFIPNGERTPIQMELKSQVFKGTDWKWGYPYNPTDRASDVIPRFPDDPKSKHVGHVAARQSAEEFFVSIQIRSEFFRKVSGFFVVVLDRRKTGDLRRPEAAAVVSCAPFKLVGNFDTLANAVVSTKRAMESLKVRFKVSPVELSPRSPPPSPLKLKSGVGQSLRDEDDEEVVSNVQSLVKKKKRPRIVEENSD